MIEPGTEVVVAFASSESVESAGSVVLSGPNWVKISTHERYVVLNPGISVSIREKEGAAPLGWGEVTASNKDASGVTLDVGGIRWEDEENRRAPRYPVEVRLGAEVLGDGGVAPKKTIGHTVNVSLTGIRAKVRSPLPEGSTVHITLHFGSAEPLQAVAKVMRSVPGTETCHGAFEIGMEFVRVISGYGEFAKAFADAEPEPEIAEEVAPADESAA